MIDESRKRVEKMITPEISVVWHIEDFTGLHGVCTSYGATIIHRGVRVMTISTTEDRPLGEVTDRVCKYIAGIKVNEEIKGGQDEI